MNEEQLRSLGITADEYSRLTRGERMFIERALNAGNLADARAFAQAAVGATSVTAPRSAPSYTTASVATTAPASRAEIPVQPERAALPEAEPEQEPTLTSSEMLVLAEKVYALMKQELRIERERLGKRG